jgi:hypothetical protein
MQMRSRADASKFLKRSGIFSPSPAPHVGRRVFMSRGLLRPELGLKLTIELGLATFPLSLGDFACGLRDAASSDFSFAVFSRALIVPKPAATSESTSRLRRPLSARACSASAWRCSPVAWPLTTRTAEPWLPPVSGGF